MSQPVRVRMAPSPTGDPHVGTFRTALVNWLFARHAGGTFILRLEDTDRERYVPGSEEKIYSNLDWLGFTPDEGPRTGGKFGPYIQSERLALYQQHARQLIERGAAYECYCTSERLDQMRVEQQARKLPPQYDQTCRDLTEAERAKQRAAGGPIVVRLRVPESGQIILHDLIRGDVTFSLATIDDSVLLKSDGFPTYHLAVVVDDHEMKISHVIRGEEWLPSTPKHLLLFQAFGWDLPQFAHLPLLLGRDRSKLSKRHGSASFQSFIDLGYLPEAMVNFLALLGWNPGGEQEIFSRDELISKFTLDHVQQSGAVFDTVKLDWVNQQHMRRLSENDFRQRLIHFLSIKHPEIGEQTAEWQQLLAVTARERIKFFSEIESLAAFLFGSQTPSAEMLIPKKGSASDAMKGLQTAEHELSVIPDTHWTLQAVTDALHRSVETIGSSASVLWPVRVAVTGQVASPPVYESVALLTKAEVMTRLDRARTEFLKLSGGE